jgi:O-acetylhomoserine (thiol)-lyase
MNFDKAVSTPIVSSAAFSYNSSNEAQDIFSGKSNQPLYSRMGNPTTTVLENKLAKLDDGIACICTSSGMGAISMSILSLCSSGDEIIAIGGLFGGTYALFYETLVRFGIKTTFLNADQLDDIEKHINENTKLIYCESVGNPNLRLLDIKAIGDISSIHNIAFILDNTSTAQLLKPFTMGVDIIVYSTTKILSGNSTALGGASVFRAINNDEDKFKTSRYKFMDNFINKLGKKALYGVNKKRALRDFGMSANANASYHTLLGLETLELRNAKINANCELIAKALYEKGININHPSLRTNIDNKLYKQYYKNGCGSVITIDMGTKQKAFDFLDKSKHLTLTANIGDTRTLGLHMGSTIFSDFDDTQKEFLGITDGLIRLSIGIENPNTIIDDLIYCYESIEDK